MKNLQFDTFLCKIHGIVAEIYANTPDIALARFIFPSPFYVIVIIMIRVPKYKMIKICIVAMRTEIIGR